MAFVTNLQKRLAAAKSQLADVYTPDHSTHDWKIMKGIGHSPLDQYTGPLGKRMSYDSDWYIMRDPIEGTMIASKTAFWDEVKTAMHHRNVKAHATTIGLSYWPALLNKYNKVDKKAYLIAEGILFAKTGHLYGEKDGKDKIHRGGWDSKGDHGISPRRVAECWLLAGAKDCTKFRIMIKNHEQLAGCFHRVRPSHTVKDILDLMRADQWIEKHTKTLGHENTEWQRCNLSTKTIICLGKMSPHLRWAAVHNVRMPDEEHVLKLRVRDLNWEAVKQVQDKVVSRNHYVPERVQSRTVWYNQMFKIYNKHAVRVWIAMGCVNLKHAKIAMGTLFWLLDKVQSRTSTEAYVNMLKPCLTLTRLFGKDKDSLMRYVSLSFYENIETPTALAIHDAGQLLVPTEYFSPVWGKFLLAKPTLKSKFSYIAKAEKHLGHPPTSLEEAIAALDAVYSATDSLLDTLDEHEAKHYRRLIGEEKMWEEVPAPGGVKGLVNGQYSLRQLEVGDLRAPMIGMLTDCCQHLNGAAGECARQSYTSPYSAVWVVFKKEEIVAQSWVWKSKDGTVLVMDSVEALQGHRTNHVVADLFIDAASDVIGKLGVTTVAISWTQYGMTSYVRNLNSDNGSIDCPPMAKRVGYSDASAVLKIMASTSTSTSSPMDMDVSEPSEPYEVELDEDANEQPTEETGVLCEHCGVDVYPAADTCWNCGEDISEWVD